MVALDLDESPKCEHIELVSAKQHCEKFLLDLSIVLLSRRQGSACISDWLSLLEYCCSKPMLGRITLQGCLLLVVKKKSRSGPILTTF